ncbi:hypothetical protein Pmi06nite_21150 [Planotetraspora mira]|uniref:Uncharacterized protein n=1 Tax=Planotetraspora mira TaxID=58121 RepID=A0A8J3TKE6_9ACTN|nr:hypothetical protein Pmi06nite_21150 [Planotetraspora mira]
MAADRVDDGVEAVPHDPVHSPDTGGEQDLDELVGDRASGHGDAPCLPYCHLPYPSVPFSGFRPSVAAKICRTRRRIIRSAGKSDGVET